MCPACKSSRSINKIDSRSEHCMLASRLRTESYNRCRSIECRSHDYYLNSGFGMSLTHYDQSQRFGFRWPSVGKGYITEKATCFYVRYIANYFFYFLLFFHFASQLIAASAEQFDHRLPVHTYIHTHTHTHIYTYIYIYIYYMVKVHDRPRISIENVYRYDVQRISNTLIFMF